MPKFMTGRLSATRPAHLSDLEVYAAGKLPTPPPSAKAPKCLLPMDNNDVEGDCTIAGVDHLIRLWNALYPGEILKVPTQPQIKSTYRGLTGGGDTGLVEADVLKAWMTKGLFGTKIEGYAPIKPTSLLTIHQSIAFYGAAYLGILCPESAQEQFENGEPWTYRGEETDDGHCVVAVGYDERGDLEVATWGGIAKLTAGFRAHYLDEAWCILGPQLLAAKKDTLGIDLAALTADLSLV
jgi:hypothetical protein